MDQAEKGEEGENREEKAAAATHAKHMSCMKKSLRMYAYREEKGEVGGGVAWKYKEDGRDVRAGWADPLRSAASLVHLQSTKRKQCNKGDFTQRKCSKVK